MVNYGQATAFLLLLCSIETGQGFVSQQRPRQIHWQVTTTPSSQSSSPSSSSSFPSSPLSDSTDRRSRRRKTFGAFAKASTTSLGVASTPDLRGLSDDDGLCIQTTIQNVTETCLETLTKAVEAVDDADEEAIAVKRKIVKERTTGNYEVAFPLRPSSAIESTMEESIGVSLCQVEPGVVVSDLHLNMDTLKYQEMAAADGYEVLDPSTLTNKFGTDFRGIVVSAVHKEGRAWAVGVRVGDVLTATSATLGGVSDNLDMNAVFRSSASLLFHGPSCSPYSMSLLLSFISYRGRRHVLLLFCINRQCGPRQLSTESSQPCPPAR